MQAIGPITRAKYYAVWSLSESAHILSGWGFSPQGSASSPHILSCPLAWAAAANVDLLAVELPSNPKLLLDAWNIKTATWLRKCVYKRLNEGSTKTGGFSTIVTFMTSALWVRPLPFIIAGRLNISALARHCPRILPDFLYLGIHHTRSKARTPAYQTTLFDQQDGQTNLRRLHDFDDVIASQLFHGIVPPSWSESIIGIMAATRVVWSCPHCRWTPLFVDCALGGDQRWGQERPRVGGVTLRMGQDLAFFS